jgi:hypothetical protein
VQQDDAFHRGVIRCAQPERIDEKRRKQGQTEREQQEVPIRVHENLLLIHDMGTVSAIPDRSGPLLFVSSYCIQRRDGARNPADHLRSPEIPGVAVDMLKSFRNNAIINEPLSK